MVSKLKIPVLLSPTTPARNDSPELGSPSRITQYNKSTGRPIRKSVGKVKQAAGYVDSGILEEEEDFIPLSSDESSEGEADDDAMSLRGRPSKTKPKRKRSPSPPSPRLEPIIYDQELEKLTDDESGGAFHRHTPKKPPITLQFNVPLGFHGPLFVKLDSALLRTTEEGTLHDMHPGKKARTKGAQTAKTVVQASRKGFTDLPPELRNTVYGYLFVGNSHVGKDIKIPPTTKGMLCKSAQFLRTCKLVYSEGCSVLYGENTFHFHRHHNTRAPFWETVPKEIGYQDVLHLLKMIGPENLQYLRDVTFVFDDALPKYTPYLATVEQRRYLCDEYLMNCLRILRDGKLRKFSVQFYGRRQLLMSDVKFLGYLEQVKADEVIKLPSPWPYHSQDKIRFRVWGDLKEAMTRHKKLYEK